MGSRNFEVYDRVIDSADALPCMKRLVVVLMLALFLLGVGCMSIMPQETVPSPAEPARDVASSQGSNELLKGSVTPSSTGGLPTEPLLIKNADLRLEVATLEPALERVRQVASDQNGTLSDLDLRSEAGERRTATATVKVPSARFDATLSALRAVGQVRSESVRSEDVTEEFVDLRAKQSALSEQLVQYRRIMANTSTVEDVIVVQKEIERIQVELDRAEGRLRYLESRTSFSRITLRFEEPAPIAGGAIPSIVEVLGVGVQGFFAVLSGLVVITLSLLPLVVLAVIGWLLYRWYRGRRT